MWSCSDKYLLKAWLTVFFRGQWNWNCYLIVYFFLNKKHTKRFCVLIAGSKLRRREWGREHAAEARGQNIRPDGQESRRQIDPRRIQRGQQSRPKDCTGTVTRPWPKHHLGIVLMRLEQPNLHILHTSFCLNDHFEKQKQNLTDEHKRWNNQKHSTSLTYFFETKKMIFMHVLKNSKVSEKII